MFDWISDAIDWIGDGISSLWDNTIGSAVDTITDAIWDVMFEWLFNLIYGAVADLFEFINASTSSIFRSVVGAVVHSIVPQSRMDAVCLWTYRGGV